MADVDFQTNTLEYLLDLDSSFNHLLEQARFLADANNPLDQRLQLAPVFTRNIRLNSLTKNNPKFKFNQSSLGNPQEASAILETLQTFTLTMMPEVHEVAASVVPHLQPPSSTATTSSSRINERLKTQKEIIDRWNQLNLEVPPLVQKFLASTIPPHLMPSDPKIAAALHDLSLNLSAAGRLDAATVASMVIRELEVSSDSTTRLAARQTNPKDLQSQLEKSAAITQTIDRLNDSNMSLTDALQNTAYPHHQLIQTAHAAIADHNPNGLVTALNELSQQVQDPNIANNIADLAIEAQGGHINPNLEKLLETANQSNFQAQLHNPNSPLARLLNAHVINQGLLGQNLTAPAMEQSLITFAHDRGIPNFKATAPIVEAGVSLAQYHTASPLPDNYKLSRDNFEQAANFLKIPADHFKGWTQSKVNNYLFRKIINLLPQSEQTKLLTQVLDMSRMSPSQLFDHLLRELPQITSNPEGVVSHIISGPGPSQTFFSSFRNFLAHPFDVFRSFFGGGEIGNFTSTSFGASVRSGLANFGSAFQRTAGSLLKGGTSLINQGFGWIGRTLGLGSVTGGAAVAGGTAATEGVVAAGGAAAATSPAWLTALLIALGIIAVTVIVAVILAVFVLFYLKFSHTSAPGQARTQMQTLPGSGGGIIEENPYASLTKTADPAVLEDPIGAITYTYTLTAKQGPLTDVTLVSDNLNLYQKSGSQTNALSPQPPPDTIETEFSSDPFTFGLKPSMDDAAITNAVTISFTAPDGNQYSLTAMAATLIGKPPTGCFIFQPPPYTGGNITAGPWPANVLSQETAASAKIMSSFSSSQTLLCRDPINVYFAIAGTSITCGGWYLGGGTIAIDSRQSACTAANALYTLAHESGHVFDERSGGISATSFRQKGFVSWNGSTCENSKYPFDISDESHCYSENFAEGFARCINGYSIPEGWCAWFANNVFNK